MSVQNQQYDEAHAAGEDNAHHDEITNQMMLAEQRQQQMMGVESQLPTGSTNEVKRLKNQ